MSGDDRQTVAMLSDQLRALAPLVAAHRDGIDADRRLPAPIFDALVDVGAFRLWLPRTLGGYELSPLGFMAVVEAASALDGSIGWLVGNGGGMSRAAGVHGASVVCSSASIRGVGNRSCRDGQARGWRISSFRAMAVR